VCKLPSALPDLTGANTGTFVAVTCQDANCQKCQNDYTICTQCKTAVSPAPQYYLHSNICKLPSALPDGMGANSGTLAATACQDTNCKQCQNDYTICTLCKNPTSPQYYLHTGTCKLPSALPDGTGANTATFGTTTCQDTNCKQCQNDYTICTLCSNPTTPQYYLHSNTCKLPAALPDGTGANTVTFGTAACQDTNCKQCQINYTICTLCKNPTTPQYYLHSSTCKLPSALPDGTGANTATFGTTTCQDTNCKQCQNDYTICTLCKNPTTPQYYLHSNTCKLPAALPDGTGANTATFGTTACQDTNCKQCQNSYTVCTSCKTAVSPAPQYYLYNSACALPSALPDGTGANTGTLVAVSCQNTNCQKCQNSYTVCTQCKTAVSPAPQYYLYSSDCVLPSALPDGTGANTGTLVATACQDTNCKQCQNSYTVCTLCKNPTSPQYYLHSNTCKLPSALPDGTGANTVTFGTTTCQDTNCKQCQNDYTICTSCKTAISPAPQYYLYSSACVLPSTLPDGTGANTGTLVAVSCQDTNCQKCQNDYTLCTTCKTAVSPSPQYYLYTSACLLPSSLPNGIGADSSTKTANACQDSNCKVCQNDYTVCTLCKNPTTPQYYLHSNTCKLPAALPDGTGANTATFGTTACQDTNCKQCQNSYTVCTSCKTAVSPAPQYYLYNSACALPSALPDGTGANTGTLVAVSCQNTNCQKCQNSYTVCTQCKTAVSPAPQYYLYSSDCVLPSALPALPDGTGANTGTRVAVTCQDTNCKQCQNDYTICTLCKNPTTPQYYLHSNTCKLPAALPDGTGANTVTFGTAACQDTNCKQCQINYTICTLCKNPTTPQYYLHSSTCKLPSALPDGTGANTATFGTTTCQDTNCKQCQNDYTICTLCKNPTTPQYYLHSNTCKLPAALPDGTGANTATFGTTACQDTNCKQCQNSYTVCTSCKTAVSPAPQYYLYNSACALPSALPDGTGANTGTLVAVSCQNTNCQKCQNSYTVCTQCKTAVSPAPQYYLYSSDCVLPSALPDGTGANTSNRQTSLCSDSLCLRCQVNYQFCTDCQISSPQKYLYNSQCVLPFTLPTQFGPNLSTLKAVSCQDPNCDKCKTDYTICTNCIGPVSPQYFAYLGLCKLPSDFPISVGPDSSDYTGRSCADTSCETCLTTYTSCTKCLPESPQKFAHSGTCKLPSNLPITIGGNAITRIAVTCQDTQCSWCQDDYQICTDCTGPSTPQYYLYNNGCVLPSTLPDLIGANTVNYRTQACQDPNCLKCQEDYTICTACSTAVSPDPQTYLYLQKCVLPETLPSTLGPNLSTLEAVTCNVSDCDSCKTDYLKCDLCLQSPDHLYLYSNACLLYSALPTQIGAGPSPDYLGLQCDVQDCDNCKADYLICTVCNASPTMYYLHSASNQCLLPQNIPDTFGAKEVLGKGVTATCNVASCQKCQNNYLTCTKCLQPTFPAPSLYLHSNQCLEAVNLPDTFGAASTVFESKTCQLDKCKDCRMDYKVCALCLMSAGQQYYLKQSLPQKCYIPSEIPNYFGASLTSKFVEPCSVPFCFKCQQDIHICTECDSTTNHILVGNECITEIAIRFNKAQFSRPDSIVAAIPTYTKPTFTTDEEILTYLAANLVEALSVSVYSVTPDISTREYLKEIQAFFDHFSQFIITDVRSSEKMTKEAYKVLFTKKKLLSTTLGGEKVAFNIIDSTISIQNGITANSQLGKVMSKFTLSTTSTSDTVGVLTATTLLTLDPTGTFFKTASSLHLFGRLYFINVNYGPRLGSLLYYLTPNEQYEPILGREQVVYNNNGYRHKVDSRKVTVDFMGFKTLLVWIYIVSWIGIILKRIKIISDLRMGKIGIYFCHYANKVHLIIFNLVFIDFIWLAPRTLLHSRDLPVQNYLGTLVVAILLLYDFGLILAHLLDDRIWRKALEHYTRKKEGIPIEPEVLDPEHKNNKINPNYTSLKFGPDRKHAFEKAQRVRALRTKRMIQTKQINYKKTYFEIDFNVHLMDIAANYTTVDFDVYESRLCRVLVLRPWLHMPLVNLILLSTQYLPFMASVILIGLEVTRLIATIYAYLKYKYLKNIICLLIEISQGVFITSFYAITLLISPKRFDEIIMDFYQDAGIWIVIASCVAEYLLLITYIAVAAYEFFKNRKMMKKMNVKPYKYSVIQYDDPVHDSYGPRNMKTLFKKTNKVVPSNKIDSNIEEPHSNSIDNLDGASMAESGVTKSVDQSKDFSQTMKITKGPSNPNEARKKAMTKSILSSGHSPHQLKGPMFKSKYFNTAISNATRTTSLSKVDYSKQYDY
jgi:hypothetical protein